MCISYLYTIEMLEAFWLLWLGWGVVLDYFIEITEMIRLHLDIGKN